MKEAEGVRLFFPLTVQIMAFVIGEMLRSAVLDLKTLARRVWKRMQRNHQARRAHQDAAARYEGATRLNKRW